MRHLLVFASSFLVAAVLEFPAGTQDSVLGPTVLQSGPSVYCQFPWVLCLALGLHVVPRLATLLYLYGVWRGLMSVTSSGVLCISHLT